MYVANLVCDVLRTTRYPQMLCGCRKNEVQPLRSDGWTCRVVRVLPHTKSANTACKTLLMVDR